MEHWCKPSLELAGQGLGHGTTSSADILEDLLVESGARLRKTQSSVRNVSGYMESSSLRIDASCWSVWEYIDNTRSLLEICQVHKRDNVKSVLERPTIISAHWYAIVWQWRQYLLREIGDCPHYNIALRSDDWFIEFDWLPLNKRFTWRSIKN